MMIPKDRRNAFPGTRHFDSHSSLPIIQFFTSSSSFTLPLSLSGDERMVKHGRNKNVMRFISLPIVWSVIVENNELCRRKCKFGSNKFTREPIKG